MMVSALWSALVVIYGWTIFIYVLMSWFSPRGALYDIYRLLGTVCEPYIGLFRRFIPATGGIDFSPMIAWAVLEFLIGPLVGGILLRIGL